MDARKTRPVGYGVIGLKEASTTVSREGTSRPTHTVPYGTGLVLKPIPGNKLPGYYHVVPPGQKPFVIPVHIFEATSPQRIED